MDVARLKAFLDFNINLALDWVPVTIVTGTISNVITLHKLMIAC